MDPRSALLTVTKQWLDQEQGIAQRRKELRALVAHHKDTTQQLETMMRRYNVHDVGLGQTQGVLRHKVSHTYAPITRAHVESVLRKYLREDMAQNLVHAIFQTERPRVERTVLKCCKR